MKWPTVAFAALLSLLLVFPATGQAGEDSGARDNAGRIVYQYVGRVMVNFSTGTGTVYGYLTQFSNVNSASLFHGQPGETNAFLTFRADIAFQPLPPNGEIAPNTFAVIPSLVVPGTFRIYFTANPSHNWADPATFSTGTVVGEFARSGELFTLIGPIGINTASASLQASATFTLGGTELNVRRIVPHGVTNISIVNDAPLPGSTQVTPIFAFAGYATVIG